MKRILWSFAVAALCAGLFACSAAVEVKPPLGDPKLEAQDYIDIRQLIDGYSDILDSCTNNGNTYADLFTDDATFGVSSEWGKAKIWFRGREELRAAGGGGKDACRPARPNPEYHIVISPVITPAPGGAKAKSTLLTITNKTTEHGDIVHWEGGYEDTFEKTSKGWRFKSRVHVWHEIQWTDNPKDMPKRDLTKE